MYILIILGIGRPDSFSKRQPDSCLKRPGAGMQGELINVRDCRTQAAENRL